MTEDRFEKLLGPYVLGDLPAAEERDLEIHLETCPECRSNLADIRQTHYLFREAATIPGPPPDLKARVLAQAMATPRTEATGTRWKLWVPAAAALLVAALLVVGVLRAFDSPDGIPLSATALARGASGEIRGEEVGENFLVELHVQGLPDLEEGEYYEMWYADERGGRISCGTFRAEGRTTANLNAPASAVDYPEIEITREAGDGDPTSSGKVVLRGTLPNA